MYVCVMHFLSNVITDIQPLDFDNFFLFKDGTYNGIQAYKNSKLANIMFAYELCRQLDGTGVKVNAVCPGKIVPLVPALSFLNSLSQPRVLSRMDLGF